MTTKKKTKKQMAKFKYKAKDAAGVLTEGLREAANESEFLKWLRDSGLWPDSYSEIKKNTTPKPKYAKDTPQANKKDKYLTCAMVRGNNMLENIYLTKTVEEVIWLLNWWNQFTVKEKDPKDSTDNSEAVERAIRQRLIEFRNDDSTIPICKSKDLQEWQEVLQGWSEKAAQGKPKPTDEPGESKELSIVDMVQSFKRQNLKIPDKKLLEQVNNALVLSNRPKTSPGYIKQVLHREKKKAKRKIPEN